MVPHGRVWVLALLAVSPVLTGCLDTDGGPTCQAKNVLPVTWHQPGLYEAVPVDDPVNGWTFEARELEPGLPFHSEAWDAALGHGNHALTRVTWRSGLVDEAAPDGLTVWTMGRFELRPGGILTATLPGNATEAQIRDAFMTFTGSVTEADEDQRHVWLAAFMEEPSPSGPRIGTDRQVDTTRHRVDLDAPLTTDALIGDPPVPGPPEHVSGIGGTEVAYGDWTFQIEVPSKTVPVPPGTRLARGLTVDALDRVHVQVWQVPGDGPSLQGVLARLFQEAGLPDPDIPAGTLVVPDGCQDRYTPLAQGP